MPVRIYEIAKKLGIENKVVLAKAKDLGIATARVPSSSLDKITAEYLEQQLAGLHPKPEPAQSPPPSSEPILIVKATEPEIPKPGADLFESEPSATPEILKPGQSHAIEIVRTTTAASPQETPVLPTSKPEELPSPFPGSSIESAASATGLTAVSETLTEPELVEAKQSPSPLIPAGPKVGDKVGFIQLPVRPVSRTAKPAERPRPGLPARPEPPKQRLPGKEKETRTPIAPAKPAMLAPKFPVISRPDQRPTAAKGGELVAPENAEVIILKPPVVVRDLAEKLGRKPYQLIADLIELKVMASVNQAIDEEIARRLCAKYGFRFEVEKRERGAGLVHSHVKKVALEQEDKPEELSLRPPVVTIMGHVDHGKTTLLDVIRKTNVAAGEAGGITQHIGAYTIAVPHPDRKDHLQQITFLDTPGHAAFTAMRARGANVTDIVILVVAANDGVMPQTLEAISHAKDAKVPILVAVNKCDHPNANPMKVRQQLQERGLVPDDWGGETIFVDVSALTKQGIDKLLAMIVLQAELLELKANATRRAKGNVIESGLSAGGPTASVLVRTGTLRIGDVVTCGPHWGRVRALINDEGERLKEAGPSVAVKVLGLSGVPEAGAEFNVVEDEKTARLIMEERETQAHVDRAQTGLARGRVDDFFSRLALNQAKEFKILVKADTQGSVEAIVDSLKKIESQKVTLEIVHSAVGTITETDVHLATASKALILGFHTRLDNGVSDLAKREGVPIKLYSIIYELIDEVKLAMTGLLDPDIKETVVGSADVQKVFELSKGGKVAGCVIQSGRIHRGKIRVLRRKQMVYEGQVQSLRRFQDEVNEVRSGMECGIRIEGFNDFQPGDVLECFQLEKTAAKL